MSTVPSHDATRPFVFYVPEQRPFPQLTTYQVPLDFSPMATLSAAVVAQRPDLDNFVAYLRSRFQTWTAFYHMLPLQNSQMANSFHGSLWNGEEPENGFGTWTFSDGRKAVGRWQNRVFILGSVIGENCHLLFVQGRPSGTGTWCVNQETYQGTWNDGQFIQGTISFNNEPDNRLVIEQGTPKKGRGHWLHEGKKLTGRWKDDVFAGHVSCPLGTRWGGMCKNNNPWDGQGVWVDVNGNKQKGIWINGIYLK